MGVYYKLINVKAKERIEPGDIGLGGVKRDAIIEGPAAKLLMYLHLCYENGSDWTVISDARADELYDYSEDEESPEYCKDVTEKIRQEYNRSFPDAPIEKYVDE